MGADSAQQGCWGAVKSRLWLYGAAIAHFSTWFLARCCLRLPPPLGRSLGKDLAISMLRCLFTEGTHVHWRNFLALHSKLNPKEREGLVLERIPAASFGAASSGGGSGSGSSGGARDSWWITLDPQLQQAAASKTPRKASAVLMYLHGGAFMAGDPRMYLPAMRLWLQQLAELGVELRILSVGYPLAPENPFPAALQHAAAAYRWLLDQQAAAGRAGDKIILAGDSAGGNLVLTSLAHLRADANAAGPPPPPPAAAVLISPAVDFMRESVFGEHLAAFLAADRQPQQLTGGGLPPGHPSARSLTHDYVSVTEGSQIARHYLADHHDVAVRLADPLVSPLHLPSFAGLAQRFFVVWGGAEVMAPDIQRLVARLQDELGPSGALDTNMAETEPHVWPVLDIAGLPADGARVLVPYFASVILGGGGVPASAAAGAS